MLYLEDFLELIENLPSELRDRFTEIRTLDLEVQNGLDKAEKSVHDYFKISSTLGTDEKLKYFEKIKEEYRKILEDSDEKVNLATMMHDLVRRYLSKLDQEISKFKMELETDSPGVTEGLERKMKEIEQSGRTVKKEKTRKRKHPRVITNGDWQSSDSPLSTPSVMTNEEFMKNLQFANRMAALNQQSGNQSTIFKKSQSYPNRLAEVRSLSVNGAQQGNAREKAGNSSGSFLQSFTEHPESRHGRPRKLTSRVSEMLRDAIQKQEQRERFGADGTSIPYLVHGSSTEEAEGANDGADLSDQSDQQRWCICNRVSFGAMVACDDKDCPFEWFHYECVGITQPPKGKWFCPHCVKRRK